MAGRRIQGLADDRTGSVQLSITTGGTYDGINGDTVDGFANKIISPHPSIGKKINSVQMQLTGSPNANVLFGVWNSSSVLQHTFSNVTWSSPWVTFSSTTSYTLQDGDFIGFYNQGGSGNANAVRTTSDTVSYVEGWVKPHTTYNSGNHWVAGREYNMIFSSVPMDTNLQSGSRFEATDTRKIYYGTLPTASAVFGKNADQVIEDFTTYANTTEGDASWITDSTTYFRVNPTTDSLDWNIITAGLRKHVYFDLGSALSDSGFVLRFKWVTTAFSGVSGIDDAGFYISATTSNSNPISQHFLGLWFDEAGSYKLIDSAGSASPESASYDATFTHSISAGTLYVEMVRLSTTSYKISFYSDSNYSNLIESKTGTLSASTTGLRYFHIFLNSDINSSGNYYGTLNDMKLWNGVTSPDFVWTEEV